MNVSAATPAVAPEPPSWARPAYVTAATAVAMVAGAATAYLTTTSVRTAAAIVLLILVAGLYVRSPKAGLIAAWVLWLLTPWLRRLFELLDLQFINSDPLAVLPYLAIGLIAFEALRTGSFSTRARWIMAAAAAGWLLGVPTGAHAFNSMAFGVVAYVTPVAVFALGYLERPRKLEDMTLYRVLVWVGPVLAVYGIVQYFAPLPSWDKLWLITVNFITADAPQQGHVRVWGTLNSPATFAGIMGLALICYLVTRRITLRSITATALIVTCLSLTYVRSAWFAVVVAILAFALMGRGPALRRVVPLVGVTVVAFSLLAGSNGTARAVINRISTFGSLSSDTSANARLSTPSAIVPIAIHDPLGAGLGQAGESSRLGAGEVFRNTDNGYLSLIYQSGPLGFLLVLGAAMVAFSSSVRMAFRGRAPRGDLLVFGLLTFLFVELIGGDGFYGVMGCTLWYLLGIGVSSEEDRVDHEIALAPSRPIAPGPPQTLPGTA